MTGGRELEQTSSIGSRIKPLFSARCHTPNPPCEQCVEGDRSRPSFGYVLKAVNFHTLLSLFSSYFSTVLLYFSPYFHFSLFIIHHSTFILRQVISSQSILEVKVSLADRNAYHTHSTTSGLHECTRTILLTLLSFVSRTHLSPHRPRPPLRSLFQLNNTHLRKYCEP